MTNEKQIIHIVALRNDERSNLNIKTAIANNIWGMQFKGKHVDIKEGDLVLFLLGISINNFEEVKNDDAYEGRFPNLTDVTLSNTEFISKFNFNVDKIILGTIESDFFQEETYIWPPMISKSGKKNFFPNRFIWRPKYVNYNADIASSPNDLKFHTDIIRALRDKGAQPSTISELMLSSFSKNAILEEYDPECDLQSAAALSRSAEVPNGPLSKANKKDSSKSSSWPRSPSIMAEAFEKSSFLCEVEKKHETFIHPKSGKNFVEGHHIIPMSKQEDFKFSLDVPENILSLCPNCHRAFHHSEPTLKKKLIRRFHGERTSGLIERGIFISLEELFNYYDCT